MNLTRYHLKDRQETEESEWKSQDTKQSTTHDAVLFFKEEEGTDGLSL